MQNVRIFGQADGDKVKVMVVLQTRSLVNEIEIEGAERISAKKLRKSIKLKINCARERKRVAGRPARKSSSYQAKGFTDVDVNSGSTPTKRAALPASFTRSPRERRARSAAFSSRAIPSSKIAFCASR